MSFKKLEKRFHLLQTVLQYSGTPSLHINKLTPKGVLLHSVCGKNFRNVESNFYATLASTRH